MISRGGENIDPVTKKQWIVSAGENFSGKHHSHAKCRIYFVLLGNNVITWAMFSNSTPEEPQLTLMIHRKFMFENER